MNSTEVGKKLNTTAETVRKYSKMIEEESDYRFLKDANGNKVYREEDLPIFERLIELKNSNLPLKLAAQLANKESGTNTNEIQKVDSKGNFGLVGNKEMYEGMVQFFESQKLLIEAQNEKIDLFEKTLQQQNELITKQSEMIAQQNEILSRLEAKKEEVEPVEVNLEIKKGFWSRVFGN